MTSRDWNTQSRNRSDRLARAAEVLGPRLQGKSVATEAVGMLPVSYTHLTLPTNREV